MESGVADGDGGVVISLLPRTAARAHSFLLAPGSSIQGAAACGCHDCGFFCSPGRPGAHYWRLQGRNDGSGTTGACRLHLIQAQLRSHCVRPGLLLCVWRSVCVCVGLGLSVLRLSDGWSTYLPCLVRPDVVRTRM